MKPRAPLSVLMASPEDIEAQFYDALQSADLDRFMALWAEDEPVVCIHPGGERLAGLSEIRAGFEALFSRGAISVQTADVHKLHSDTLAVHRVHERVHAGTGPGARMAWVWATNVYAKGPQGWRLVLHHASPGQAAESTNAAHGGDGSTLH